MRKTILTVVVTLAALHSSLGQSVYVDPTTTAAMTYHAGVMNRGLDRTSDNLTAIERGQLAVASQLKIVNDIQDKIHKGLTEVSEAVKSLYTIKSIADISVDIVQNLNATLEEAKSNPQFLIFAEGQASEFKSRSVALALEVQQFILRGGTKNMMDAGERARLLTHIQMELRIIRAVTYGMYKAIYYAKLKGFWNALNPYSGYINIDRKLARDAARKARYLTD